MTQFIDAATTYAKSGLKVFPLQPESKAPLTTHGVNDASGDLAQVKKWWGRNPRANIGVACGEGSGILAADLDVIDDTNAYDGQATWAKLTAHYGEVETREQKTGGGGRQLVFAHPGVEIGNRTQILPGIDVRGDGGYIVVAPSIHPDTGKAYQWVNDVAPQQPPIWWLGILFDDDARLEALKVVMPSEAARLAWSKEYWKRSPEIAKPVQARVIDGPTVSADSGEFRRWLEVTVEKARKNVENAPEGMRNWWANKEAYSLAGYARYISESEIERIIFDASVKNRYVSDDGATEVRNAIRSGIKSGKEKPRPDPELTPARPPAVVMPAMESGDDGFVPSDDGQGGVAVQALPQKVMPRIKCNRREPREVIEEMLAVMADSGKVFVRGGELVRVKIDERRHASIEAFSEKSLRSLLCEHACFYNVVKAGKKDEDGFTEIPISPPWDMVGMILGQGEWTLPPLEGVIESPVMRPDGTFIRDPGYDAATWRYYWPVDKLDLSDVPEYPTQADAKQALTTLRDVIVDFPLKDEASADNAIGLELTIVARPMIPKSVPIPIVTAPQQGTGKTLLASILVETATGEEPNQSPAPTDKDEWRKTITSKLSTGKPVVVFDNLTHTLEDSSLAIAATAEKFSDRRLGFQSEITLPAKTIWIVTGNNVKVGGDLVQRCYPIYLDAKSSKPQERDDFKHPNINGFIRKNRSKLVGAMLTILRAWVLAGRPQPTCRRVRFEHWREVVGGALEYAGATHFLGNLSTFYEEADTDGPIWEEFILKLAEIYGTDGHVTPAMIFARFASNDELRGFVPADLAEFLTNSEDAKARAKFTQALGYELQSREGKRFGDSEARIERASDGRKGKGGKTWKFISNSSVNPPR